MSKSASDTSLTAILRRSDVWRGESQRFTAQHTLDTGYTPLNQALLGKGWPLGALMEVCQPHAGHSEWRLFSPALSQLRTGYIVLLNPPAMPFCQGIVQMGLDLNRIVVVQCANKEGFLKSFVELARAKMCRALLAWQPNKALSYTELRKCLLAASATNLSVLFRDTQALQQSSPASLRLACDFNGQSLSLNLHKQKGLLTTHYQSIHLPLAPIIGSVEQGLQPSPLWQSTSDGY